MKKANIFIWFGFALSIFIHLVLLNVAVELYLKWDFLSDIGEAKLFEVQQVHSEPESKIKIGRSEWSVEKLIDITRPVQEGEQPLQNMEELERALAEEALKKQIDLGKDELEDLISLLTVKPEELRKELESPAETADVMQEVMVIEEELLEEEIEPSRRAIASNLPRGYAQSDFITLSGAATPTGEISSTADYPVDEQSELEQIRRKAFSATVQPLPPSKSTPPETTKTPPQKIEESEIPAIAGAAEEDLEKIRKYPALDDLLKVGLYTYQPPDESDGFFMVVIEPRKQRKTFEVIPKDIVFVVDSSRSILQRKLKRYKTGLKQCLKGLNEADRFTIIEFKNYVNLFSENLVPVTEEQIRRGSVFIEKMTSSGETDIYQSFAELIAERPSVNRPYIILLISDGRATTGLVKNREIINKISFLNSNKSSIYTFAGGQRTNRYLLDLLAYRNKGESGFEPNFSQIEESLYRFYKRIRYPLLINLRYNMVGIDQSEVYPKQLPDFFYNSKLVIVGRYGGQEEFCMQILGQVCGVTKEFIFKKKFALSDGIDPEVARLWAFNKIYHLIGYIASEGESPEIIDQIQQLSQKYNVRSPY